MEILNEPMKFDLNNDKIRVFNTLIIGIETAIDQKSARLFIKDMKVMGDSLDVVAERADWPVTLKKAQDFFESIEDYEKCAKCKSLIDYLKNNDFDTDAKTN
jgi:hypothetical protein